MKTIRFLVSEISSVNETRKHGRTAEHGMVMMVMTIALALLRGQGDKNAMKTIDVIFA